MTPMPDAERGPPSADELIEACPNCDSAASISESRVRRRLDPDRRWFCGDCRSYFAEPIERQSLTGLSPDTLARKLVEMDADQIETSRGPS